MTGGDAAGTGVARGDHRVGVDGLCECQRPSVLGLRRHCSHPLTRRRPRYRCGGLLRRRHRAAAAQERLAAERERLAVTLRSIGDGVIATDAEGRVIIMNAVAEAMTGWSEAEAIGRPLARGLRIYNEPTGAPPRTRWPACCETGQVQALANHTVLVSRDGARRAHRRQRRTHPGAGGRAMGVVLVFQDVTERALPGGGAGQGEQARVAGRAGRRHRPRLQQPAHRHPWQHRPGQDSRSTSSRSSRTC